MVLPQGTTSYAIAFSCPFTAFIDGTQDTFEEATIIEATLADGNQFSGLCGPSVPSNQGAPITGSVDATALSGVQTITVTDGGAGLFSFFSIVGNAGTFTLNLPTAGANDVTIAALDVNGNALAIKILRNQNSPGPVNNGNPIVLGAGDVTTPQPLTVANIPPASPLVFNIERYQTANGALIEVASLGLTQYSALPAAAVQSGDFYSFDLSAAVAGSSNPADSVDIFQSTSSAGGPVSLSLPAVWTPLPPQPAGLPSFTFVYSGFSGSTNTVQNAQMTWGGAFSNQGDSITVFATSSFQNGATTVKIPDLSSISGFPATPISGTIVFWTANIFGSLQVAPFVMSPLGIGGPPNTSVPSVASSGSYTVP